MIRFFVLILTPGMLAGAEFKSERQRSIEYQLNAPCCWGGVIAEHDSPIAEQMKEIISQFIDQPFVLDNVLHSLSESYLSQSMIENMKSNIHNNMSDDEIIAFFTTIHGEKIRALPANEGIGWVAWKLPIFILAISILGAGIILTKFRSRNNISSQHKLTQDQLNAVDTEMKSRGI